MPLAFPALRLLVPVLVLVPAAAAAQERPLPPGTDHAEATITASGLAAATRFLSDDLLEGRAPASRGEALARLYVRTQLESWGYRPGGVDGGWEQPFPMVGVTTRAPQAWTFRRGDREVALDRSREFVAVSGVQSEAASLEQAELVFVGYGIVAPEFGWNDYKDADLRGKVLVMLNNDPEWDPALFGGPRRLYYGRWTYKYESAAAQGAAGALIVHTRPSAGYGWNVVQTSWSGEQFELPAAGEPRLQLRGWLHESAAREIATLAGHSMDGLVEAARRRDFRPMPLGVTTSIALANTLRRVETANVIGVLPGRDPALREEAVVITAHHDHLGTGEPDAQGDTIYNGALDNAAGMAQMLAVARAMASLPDPPRRSVLVIAIAAEEQGLLGSQWYAEHPTIPPGRVAANVNFDGGNIWGRTAEIPLVGLGKSSIDRIAMAAAARQGRLVVDEPFPDRGFYYRSDQLNFARIGVPALYFDTSTRFLGKPEGWGRQVMEAWESEQYHQPSDEIGPDWNLEGMVEDARFGFLVSLMIAEDDEMPSWTPGDEFEAARRRAMEAARGAGAD